MRLTDESLRLLVSLGHEEARAELRNRVRWQIIRLLPNPTGVCPHGRKIEWDHRGAYSSGYPMGCDRCMTDRGYLQIVNDPPTGRRKALLDLLDSIPK